MSKPENWDQNDCYEQVFNDGALHRRPLEYSDQGLLTMDPSAGEGLTLGPPIPPILPLPTSKKDGLLPSHLQHQVWQLPKFYTNFWILALKGNNIVLSFFVHITAQ